MAGNLPAQASSGWTVGRVIALATGSVLLLISLALIAGGGILAWADQEQLRSGYLTTTTTTYSTSGYALASDPIKPHGAWGWLSLFVEPGPDPDLLVRPVPSALRGYRRLR